LSAKYHRQRIENLPCQKLSSSIYTIGDFMTKQLRGLALLPPERRKEIARKGALAIHAKGLAHIWSAQEARVASLKGWGKDMKIEIGPERKKDEEVA
jgi:hypothetical protein